MKDKNIYLPQFAGQSNPYDVLWFLAIELGRIQMLKVQSIGTAAYQIQVESEEALRTKYDVLSNELAALSEEERTFLRRDSNMYSSNITVSDVNHKLMKMSSESYSDMSLMHSLDSEAYLRATLGEEEGKKEAERRIELVKKCRNVELTAKYCRENNISDNDAHYVMSVRKSGMENCIIRH